MLSFIVEAFQIRGGRARLSDIYPEVRRLLKEYNRPNKAIEATVRGRVYNHCPQRASYLGTAIFKLCGRGEYKLETEIPFSDIPIYLWEEPEQQQAASET
jgi:hypothetical protein